MFSLYRLGFTQVGFTTAWQHDEVLGQKKNKTLVSGNAGDEKNLHPGGHKKVFFINLIEFFK